MWVLPSQVLYELHERETWQGQGVVAASSGGARGDDRDSAAALTVCLLRGPLVVKVNVSLVMVFDGFLLAEVVWLCQAVMSATSRPRSPDL